jgi:hypothetical protein
MKKIISILSIIAILTISLFCFTGCGNDIEKKENSDNKVNNEDENFLDNNDSYYFIFDGKKYKAGDKISDLNQSGLLIREWEKEEIVPANTYMIGAGYIVNSENKTVFQVVPYNIESSEVKILDAHISGFKLDEYDVKNDSRLADVEIYGGIKLGSTLEELQKVFGTKPSFTHEGTLWTSYDYESDEVYRDFRFRIDKEGKVIYIEWQNLVFND